MPDSLRRARTCGTRGLRVSIGRPQTSPRHDHRRASCSVTVPQTPLRIPARGGWRITSKAHREPFPQVKPSRRQCSLTPDPGGIPRARLCTPLRMHSFTITKTPDDLGFKWWQVLGSNQRRLSRRLYRPLDPTSHMPPDLRFCSRYRPSHPVLSAICPCIRHSGCMKPRTGTDSVRACPATSTFT